MKSLRISLPFIALLIALSASAIITGSQKVKTPDPMYHWFAPYTNIYLGQRTVAAMDQLCPGNGQICANGFTGVTQNEEPAGASIGSVEKQ
jgi:hypothetical protein